MIIFSYIMMTVIVTIFNSLGSACIKSRVYWIPGFAREAPRSTSAS